jgi:hypothetical protein
MSWNSTQDMPDLVDADLPVSQSVLQAAASATQAPQSLPQQQQHLPQQQSFSTAFAQSPPFPPSASTAPTPATPHMQAQQFAPASSAHAPLQAQPAFHFSSSSSSQYQYQSDAMQ